MPSGSGSDVPASPAAGQPGSDPRGKPRCVHCKMRAGRVGRNGSRGLCKACYADRATRDLYPAIRRGAPGQKRKDFPSLHRESGRKGRMPRTPTQALPGSEEKIRVLMERAARGEVLFHPQDAQADARDEPLDLESLGSVRACDLEQRRPRTLRTGVQDGDGTDGSDGAGDQAE